MGQRVRVVKHHVQRRSPFLDHVGEVVFVPPDGQWPYLVAFPDAETARKEPLAFWPTAFSADELEAL